MQSNVLAMPRLPSTPFTVQRCVFLMQQLWHRIAKSAESKKQDASILELGHAALQIKYELQ